MQISTDDLQIISDHQPLQRNELSLVQAAVAIILRDGEHGTEFLLMQRAIHENDPWSGQMSFPGGKIDREDISARAAAIRESEEEVAIVLRDEDYVGQLDDLYGLKVDNKFSVHVSCFVFKPQRELQPVGNHEVADLVWLPFSYLNDTANAFDYYHPKAPQDGSPVKMPAVMINEAKEQILWGLSLRMLSMFYELLGWQLTALSEGENNQLREAEQRGIDSSKLDDVTKKLLDEKIFQRRA